MTVTLKAKRATLGTSLIPREGNRGPAECGSLGPEVGHPVAAAGLEAAPRLDIRAPRKISAAVEKLGECDLKYCDGLRQSAEMPISLTPLGRPNMDVVASTLVHRVRLDGDDAPA